MDPEDDFENWSMILTTLIEPSGDYQYLLEGYLKLITQIIVNSKLEGKLEIYTENFITDTVPIVTRKLLNFPYVNQQEQNVVIKFLLGGARIAAWAFANDNFELYNELSGVFDSDANYYTKNWQFNTMANFESLIQNFIHYHGVKIMTERITNNSNPLVLDHFFYYYSLMNIRSKALQETISVCLNTFHIFMQFLQTVEPDNAKIQNTCTIALNIALKIPESKQFFDDMLLYAEKLVENDKVSIQINGATILNAVCSATVDHAKQSYNEWKKNTKLCNILVESNLNSKLLSALEPVYVSILNSENLAKLWSNAAVAHSSERSTMLSIVAKALYSIDLDESKQFIDDSLVKEPNNETLSFLSETFESSFNHNEEFSLYVLQKLIEIPNSGQYVVKTITYKMKEKFKIQVINKCLENLDKYPDTCLEIMKKVGEQTYQNAKIFPADIITFLIQKVKDGIIQKQKLFPFIQTYIERNNKEITQEFLNNLIEIGEDDTLWAYLNNTFEKQGIKSLSRDCYISLAKVLDRQNKSEMSMTLANLCYRFILNYAYLYNKIRNEITPAYAVASNLPPQKFVIDNFPLEFIKLLSDGLLQCTNLSVSIKIKSYLLALFMNSKNAEQTTNFALSLFKNSQTELAKQRSIDLITDFIIFYKNNKFFPEDFDIIPHQKRFNSNDKRIPLIIDYRGSQKTILVSTKSKPETLRSRISLIYQIDEKSFQIQINKANIINYQNFENVKPNSIISVVPFQHNSVPRINVKFPLILLSNINFQEQLLELLDADSPELQESAFKLLNMLPTCNSIKNLAKNENELIEKVKNSSTYSFRYIIEYLSQLPQFSDPYPISRDDEPREYQLFFSETKDLLFSKLSDIKIRSKLLSLLNYAYNDSFNEYIEETVPILLNSFEDDCILMENSIFMLQLMETHDPTTAKYLFSTENMPLFINSIRKTIPELWNEYKQCLNLFPPKQLFDICLPIMDNFSKGDEHFLELFSLLVPKLSSELDLPFLIQKCITLLHKASGSNLIGICSSIDSLLKAQASEIAKYKYLTNDLIKIILKTGEEKEQESLFKLCITLGIDDWSPIIEVIENTKVENYNITPSQRVKSETGFSGLRNLGATCYMNSVIQQLFNIPIFISKVIETKLEKEGQLELQQLITRMTFTLKKSVDTQDFVSKWLGWGKRPVNPKEQQDAFEFFQLLLDQMPNECNEFFKGSIRNVMRGSTEKFETYNIESFYTIPLEVKGCKNVEESFKVFLQSETFNDYKAEGFDHPIDILKEARIESAPKVLVLQLKRFEYDLQTFNKIKINERYEFPPEIDISPLLYKKDEDEKCLYKLKGVVLHSGTAQGGHYNSLVLINNKWVMFNDQEVSYFPNSQFENEAFGNPNKTTNSYYDYDFETGPSAYLLFYTKEDFSIECETIHYNEQFVGEVKLDNDKFLQEQSIFSSKFFQYVMAYIDNPIPYLINIYSHSSLTANTTILETHLHNYFNDGSNQHINETCDYFIEHFDSIKDIYTNAQIGILNTIHKCVKTICADADIEKSEKLCLLFFDILPHLLQTVRTQIYYASSVIYFYSHSHIEKAIEDGFIQRIFDFINHIYGTQRSSVFLQSVNISPLFKSLTILITQKIQLDNPQENDEETHQDQVQNIQTDLDLTPIINYMQQIVQNPENNHDFLNLYKRLSYFGLVDLPSLLNILLNSKIDEDKEMAVKTMAQLVLAYNYKYAEEMINLSYSKKVSQYLFYNLYLKLNNRHETTRTFFLTRPDLLIKELCSNQKDTAMSCEMIVYAMFPTIQTLPIYHPPCLPKQNTQYILSDDEDEDDEFGNQNGTVIKDSDKTEYAISSKDIEDLDVLLKAIHSQIKHIKHNPKSYYSNQFQESKNTNVYHVESHFAITSFIRVFHWIVKILRLLNNEKEYDRLVGLIEVLVELKIDADKNIAQCVEMAFSFDKRIYLQHTADLCSLSILSQSQQYSMVEQFVKHFQQLKEAPLGQQIDFFSSQAALKLSTSYNYFEQHKKEILEACKMCFEFNDERPLAFVREMFNNVNGQNSNYSFPILCKIMTIVHSKINDHAYTNFVVLFNSYLESKTKNPYHSVSYTKHDFLADICPVFNKDLRWYGNIVVNNLETFPSIIAYIKEGERSSCMPLAQYIITSLPYLNQINLCKNCYDYFKDAKESEQQCALLYIILNIYLSTAPWHFESAPQNHHETEIVIKNFKNTSSSSSHSSDSEFDQVDKTQKEQDNEAVRVGAPPPLNIPLTRDSGFIEPPQYQGDLSQVLFPTTELILEMFECIKFPIEFIKYSHELISKSNTYWHSRISELLLKLPPSAYMKQFVAKSVLVCDNASHLIQVNQETNSEHTEEWNKLLQRFIPNTIVPANIVQPTNTTNFMDYSDID